MSRLTLSLLALPLAALAGCVNDTLPRTNTAGPAPAAVVTTQPVVTTTQPVVTTTTVPVVTTGTLVTTPGTTTITTVPTAATVAVVPARLSSSDIVATMAGNTASGTTADGQPYYAKFLRSGQLIYRQGSNYQDSGSWRVTTDGQLCSRLAATNSGIEQCYTLYRTSDGYVYERPDGYPVGRFVVTPGA